MDVSISNELFSQQGNAIGRGGELGFLISRILPNLIVVAGVIFFLMILFYGVGVLLRAGKQTSPAEVAKARGLFTASIIGFLLVISSYFILQIVGAMIGVNFAATPRL